MHAHGVKCAVVASLKRVALGRGQRILCGQRGRRLEEGTALGRIPVHIADRLLQRVEGHGGSCWAWSIQRSPWSAWPKVVEAPSVTSTACRSEATGTPARS